MTEKKEVTIEMLAENMDNLEKLGVLLRSIPMERLEEMRVEIKSGGNDALAECIDIEISSRELF